MRVAAPRELAERRAERVGEVQLQRVAVGALLDGDAPLRGVGVVPVKPRRVLAGDVAGPAEPANRSESGGDV